VQFVRRTSSLRNASTCLLSKAKLRTSESVILLASSERSLYGVLPFSDGCLIANQSIRIQPQTVSQQVRVGQDVREFIGQRRLVGTAGPLEEFEEFARLDADRLREILRRMEAAPLAVGDEPPYCGHRFLVRHVSTLSTCELDSVLDH